MKENTTRKINYEMIAKVILDTCQSKSSTEEAKKMSFFDLGIDSIEFIQISIELEDQYNLKVDLKDFQNPSINLIDFAEKILKANSLNDF